MVLSQRCLDITNGATSQNFIPGRSLSLSCLYRHMIIQSKFQHLQCQHLVALHPQTVQTAACSSVRSHVSIFPSVSQDATQATQDVACDLKTGDKKAGMYSMYRTHKVLFPKHFINNATCRQMYRILLQTPAKRNAGTCSMYLYKTVQIILIQLSVLMHMQMHTNSVQFITYNLTIGSASNKNEAAHIYRGRVVCKRLKSGPKPQLPCHHFFLAATLLFGIFCT